MPLRKSQLYSSLWKSCDELRGGMDASQYKDYILTLKGTTKIGDGINKVIGALADENDYLLKGMIDRADFNDFRRYLGNAPLDHAGAPPVWSSGDNCLS